MEFYVLLILVMSPLWRDLRARDLNGVIGDLVFVGLVLLLQWLDCWITEFDQSPLTERPISEEEQEDDVSYLFSASSGLQWQREFQVACDGPLTQDGEPTGECNARSPACDSGPESHEMARALGWQVSEDDSGYDACPVHREYDEEAP